MKLKIGSRKSLLAETQSSGVQKELTKLGLDCELIFIESSGDKDRKTPLYETDSSTPGLFTKELERALLDKKIDIAVHSLKDLPTVQPDGLTVLAIPKREAVFDCLLTREGKFQGEGGLPLIKGAKVGTSSLRRQAQLLSVRPDLVVNSLRGNVPTRVEAVMGGKWDGVVLAEAGLSRLKQDLTGLVKTRLEDTAFVPAPGQGALAIEGRTDLPESVKAVIQTLEDPQTRQETRVERKILRELEGGCTLPLGVRCTLNGKYLKINAFLGVLREPGNPASGWKGFYIFDNTDAVEQSLVDSTVQYFRSRMNE